MARKFFLGFMTILILNPAIGRFREYPDVPRSIEDFEGSKSLEEDIPVDSLQSDSDDNIIYDNKYPSEQLERIVEETMELLQSDNEEEKSKLKINPSDYRKYKPESYIPEPKRVKSGRILWDDNDNDDRCPVIVQEDTPKLLSDISGRDHWIFNVDTMRQTVLRKICVNNDACGEKHTYPFGYTYECKQISIRVPLFSIPVDEDLVKENQVFKEYSFPSNCVCKRKRIK